MMRVGKICLEKEYFNEKQDKIMNLLLSGMGKEVLRCFKGVTSNEIILIAALDL